MVEMASIDGNTIYAEDDRWRCVLDGRQIKLGIVFEAVLHGYGEYSFTVDAQILPQPEFLDREVVDSLGEIDCLDDARSRLRLVQEVYRQIGGIPINADAIQPPKSSCGFSSFIAESTITSVECGTEVRHFRDIQEALKFIREFYAVYAYVIFGFVEEILEMRLASGRTGREMLRMLSG